MESPVNLVAGKESGGRFGIPVKPAVSKRRRCRDLHAGRRLGPAARDFLEKYPGKAIIFDVGWKRSFVDAGVARYLVQTYL